MITDSGLGDPEERFASVVAEGMGISCEVSLPTAAGTTKGRPGDGSSKNDGEAVGGIAGAHAIRGIAEIIVQGRKTALPTAVSRRL